MRDAMSALDQVIAFSGENVRDEDVATLLGLVEPKVLSETVNAIAKNDLPVLLKTVGEQVEAGQDLNNFCRRLSGQFRNLMILKAGITDTALLGIPESLLPDLRQQADLFSREDLLRIFDAFLKIETGMKYATQVRFHLEMGLIELAHISRLRSLEDLIAEFKSMAGGEPPQKPEMPQKSPAMPSVPLKERPVYSKPSPKPAPVAEKTPPPEPARVSVPEEPSATPQEVKPTSQDPREFLLEIAAAVGRESLESLLASLVGAQLEGERVVLEAGPISEFVRKQVKENLPAISQAATKIVGRKVTAQLSEIESRHAPNPPKIQKPRKSTDAPTEGDLQDKAKREPVVKSFMDIFPGPVTTEKLDK